LLYGQVAQGA